MSYNVEFTATQANALKIIDQEHLPHCVQHFIQTGLSAFQPESLVYVKAVGHLFNADYKRSNADIVVQEVALRTPREPVEPKEDLSGN